MESTTQVTPVSATRRRGRPVSTAKLGIGKMLACRHGFLEPAVVGEGDQQLGPESRGVPCQITERVLEADERPELHRFCGDLQEGRCDAGIKVIGHPLPDDPCEQREGFAERNELPERNEVHLAVDLRGGRAIGQEDRRVVIAPRLRLVMDASDQEVGARGVRDMLDLVEDDFIEQQRTGRGGLGPDDEIGISGERRAAEPDVALHDRPLALRVPVVVDGNISLKAGDLELSGGRRWRGDLLHAVAEGERDEKESREEIEVRARLSGADLPPQSLHRDRGDSRGENAEEGQPGNSGERGDLDQRDAVAQGDSEHIPAEPRKEGPAEPLDSHPGGGGKQGHEEIPAGAKPSAAGCALALPFSLT